MTFPEWKEQQQVRMVAGVVGLIALVIALPFAVIAARDFVARKRAEREGVDANAS